MKPIDYRNATWAEIRGHLHGLRAAAYDAWLEYGPGTTREVALASGMDILTLRPRTTELIQLGFVVLVEDEQDDTKGRGKEGRYRALPEAQALAAFLTAQAEATRERQLGLALA